jgi:CHC2 zinc finger
MNIPYHKVENQEPPKTREHRYRGVSHVKPIGAAKEAVAVVDLALRLCEKLRRSGSTYVARCPLPDHDDGTPSFYVYPETNSWFCYGCSRGGDVVQLYRLANRFDQREAHAAAGHLLLEFGHTPPERPASWSRKQHRQGKVRDLEDQARIEAITRRLWRYVFRPIVMEIEDVEERKRMAERLYPKVERQAKHMVSERRKANR